MNGSSQGFYHRWIRPWVIGLTVVLIGAGLILGANKLWFSHSSGYVVHAEMADAGGVVTASDVKEDGVAVGQVKGIALTKRDTALITMTINEQAAPIGPGATVAVRPSNLLGEKYVDLEPGNLKKALPSGSTIPESRTSAPVEVNDVLDILPESTRARLRILINEAGIAMDGRGADFNDLLQQLPGSLSQIHGLLAEVGAQNVALSQAIHQGNRVVASIQNKHSDLQNLVDSASNTLKVTASRRAQLNSTVNHAPDAMAKLTHTLGVLQSASEALRPTASALSKTSPPLARALNEIPGFESAAQPTLQKATEVAPSLTKLGKQATPTVQRLRPTARELSSFSDKLKPNTKTLADGGIQGVLGLMNGCTRAIRNADGLGHYFRLEFILDKDTLTSALSQFQYSLCNKPSKVLPDALCKGNGQGTGKSAPKKARSQSDTQQAAPAAKPDSAPSAPATHHGNALGSTVRKTVHNVGNAVHKTTQNLGKTVHHLGGAVHNTTQNLGNTVRHTVQGAGRLIHGLLHGGAQSRDRQQGDTHVKNSGNVLQLFDHLFAP